MKTLDIPANCQLAAPVKDEARQARVAARLFASLPVGKRGDLHHLQVVADKKISQPIEIPESAFRLFLEILNQMAQGNAITLVPTHHELTTQQAADLFGVSRPYFVKLLDQGEIPHHRVGTRRRLNFQDLLAYMEKVKGESRNALDQLAQEAQELKMGY